MNGEYEKGRGAQINPKNRFIRQHVVNEHLEGVDEASTINHKRKLFIEHPRKILSKNDSPDIPFTYSINPYQGCEHGCVYCYARNTHPYWGFSAGMDWESKIVVKRNAPELLEKVFLKKTWKPETIALSGNTDPYQPAEQKMFITRNLLKVFVRYNNPVGIITKNSLITRDMDLLSYLARRNLVRVYFSITSLDWKMRNLLEPRTASSIKLLNAVEKLSKHGIDVGVMIGPIIPSLNDHEIHNVLRAAADRGAKYAGYTLARFNGDVGEIFADWLAKNFPDRSKKIWNKVSSIHGGQVNDSRFGKRMSGEGNYAQLIRNLFHSAKALYFDETAKEPLRTDLFRRGGNLNLFGDS